MKKLGKLAGGDAVLGEMLKYGGEEVVEWVTYLRELT